MLYFTVEQKKVTVSLCNHGKIHLYDSRLRACISLYVQLINSNYRISKYFRGISRKFLEKSTYLFKPFWQASGRLQNKGFIIQVSMYHTGKYRLLVVTHSPCMLDLLLEDLEHVFSSLTLAPV